MGTSAGRAMGQGARRSLKALVASGLIAALALTGCGGGNDADPTNDEVAAGEDTTSGGTGDSGGSNSEPIRIVLPEEPPTLDACDTPTFSVGRILAGNITESLVDRDPQSGELVPVLAESWEKVSPTEWEFSLRQDVAFHNGTPFNAEAAAKAITRALTPDLDCFIAENIFGDVEVSAEAVDEFTLSVTTDEVDPILPLRMAFMDIPAPETADGKSREPIGTGPYEFVAWDAGQSISVQRSSDYWGDEAAIVNAEYVWREESTVRASMVEAGEADLAVTVAPQDAGAEGTVIFPIPETIFFRFDTFTPPLDDIRVRRAINMAFDREGFVEGFMGGFGEPASQIILSNVTGFSENIPVVPNEPDAARSLIEEAASDGVPVDTEITIFGRFGLYPNATEAAEGLQGTLADIGLNAKVQMLETNAWLEQLLKPIPEGRVAIVQSIHGNNAGDAAFTVYSKFHSEGAESTLDDPKVDELIDTAFALSGTERDAKFQELFEYLHEEVVPVIPVAYAQGILALSPRLAYEPNPLTNDEMHLSEFSLK